MGLKAALRIISFFFLTQMKANLHCKERKIQPTPANSARGGDQRPDSKKKKKKEETREEPWLSFQVSHLTASFSEFLEANVLWLSKETRTWIRKLTSIQYFCLPCPLSSRQHY
jgi:hypothetical protein